MAVPVKYGPKTPHVRGLYSSYEPAALDVLLPHPVHAPQSLVSVLDATECPPGGTLSSRHTRGALSAGPHAERSRIKSVSARVTLGRLVVDGLL
jgi:hypothetical protein